MQDPQHIVRGAQAPRRARRGGRGVMAPQLSGRRTAQSPVVPAAERHECQPQISGHRPHPSAPSRVPSYVGGQPLPQPSAELEPADEEPEPALAVVVEPAQQSLSEGLRTDPSVAPAPVPPPEPPPPPRAPRQPAQPPPAQAELQTLGRSSGAQPPNYVTMNRSRAPNYVHPPRRAGQGPVSADRTPQYVQPPRRPTTAPGAPAELVATPQQAAAAHQGSPVAHKAVRGLQVQINHRPKPGAAQAAPPSMTPPTPGGIPGAVRTVEQLQEAAAGGDPEAQALLRQLEPAELATE